MTWYFNSVELVFVAGSLCGATGALIALLCSNCRMSRCVRIRLSPCGCECERENLSENEYDRELKNQERIEGQMARASSAHEVEEGAV